MATVIHNPISNPQEIKARLGWRRPPPKAGVVQVCISRRGDVYVADGTRPLSTSEWIAGRSWTIYEVDVSDHPHNFQCELPCRDDKGSFRAEVHLTWRVANPLEVVRRQLVDVPGALESPLEQRMRGAVSDRDWRQRRAAEMDINKTLETGLADALGREISGLGLEIRTCRAKLRPDPATTAHFGNVTQIEQRGEADSLKRRNIRDAKTFYGEELKGGFYDVLLLRLAQHPEDLREVVELWRQEDAADRAHHIAALRALIPKLEPFQIADVADKLLKSLVEGNQATLGKEPAKKVRRKAVLELPGIETDMDEDEEP